MSLNLTESCFLFSEKQVLLKKEDKYRDQGRKLTALIKFN